MSYNSDVWNNIASVEHSKFVEIQSDARFPAVTATRIEYTESVDLPPITSYEVYPKHAVITYIANASDISGGGGGSTTVTTSYPQAQSWDIVRASFGNVYTAFPSATASTVTVVNNTGTTISVKKTGGATGIPLPDRASADFNVLNNANELSMIRTDGSATTVSAYGIVTRF